MGVLSEELVENLMLVLRYEHMIWIRYSIYYCGKRYRKKHYKGSLKLIWM